MPSPTPPPYGIREAWAAWRSAAPELPGAPPPLKGLESKEATISWMLSTAEALRAREEAREESFRARGGQLAGFGAVLLGLLGSLVPDALVDLDGLACVAATSTFIVGVLLILMSILICLGSVVRPSRDLGISPYRSVDNYLRTRSLLTAKPWQLELRTLRAFPDILVWHGWLNQRKAGALFLASSTLATGLLATAACLVILAFYG